jgi:hypothetical protein
MSYRGPTIVKGLALGILLYLFAGLLAIALWKGFSEPAGHKQSRQEQPLAGALRAGAQEFNEYRARIVIGQPRVTVAPHAASGPALELIASVRNDTGRLIRGLEMRGTVVDPEGRLVSDGVAVIIPTQQTAIEPNEEINARLLVESDRPEGNHTGVRMEVTGLIFD